MEVPQAFEACDRFFAIHELVVLFLYEADALVLINGMRVCRLWKSIINDIPTLQQDLFLEPRQNSKAESSTTIMNPVLTRLLNPVLASDSSSIRTDSKRCTYDDVKLTSWARDGIKLRAPARRAFAHDRAWWRDMLVSQPPICRLDWWHYWTVDYDHADPERNSPKEGWGHQYLRGKYVTVGMLWDLVESRLKRGCTSQVFYYPRGSSVVGEVVASIQERNWAEDPLRQQGCDGSTPRVKIVTNQVWSLKPPSGSAGFDCLSGSWKNMTELRPHRWIQDGDGFSIIRDECKYDFKDENCRWSKSDGFQWAELTRESSALIN